LRGEFDSGSRGGISPENHRAKLGLVSREIFTAYLWE
jgi:hypothetical protein